MSNPKVELECERLLQAKLKFMALAGSIDDESPELTIVSEGQDMHASDQDIFVLCQWILDSVKIGKALPWHHYKVEPTSTKEANLPLAGVKLFFPDLPADEGDELAMLAIELQQEAIKLGVSMVSSCTDGAYAVSQFVDDEADRFHQRASPFWLTRIISARAFEEPHRALDYPCPFDPIPCNTRMIVSLSGFSAAEREPLIAMLALAGAIYTSDLTQNNTHLIVAEAANESSKRSAKVRWASKWDVAVRDRFWLERSFFKWAWEA